MGDGYGCIERWLHVVGFKLPLCCTPELTGMLPDWDSTSGWVVTGRFRMLYGQPRVTDAPTAQSATGHRARANGSAFPEHRALEMRPCIQPIWWSLRLAVLSEIIAARDGKGDSQLREQFFSGANCISSTLVALCIVVSFLWPASDPATTFN